MTESGVDRNRITGPVRDAGGCSRPLVTYVTQARAAPAQLAPSADTSFSPTRDPFTVLYRHGETPKARIVEVEPIESMEDIEGIEALEGIEGEDLIPGVNCQECGEWLLDWEIAEENDWCVHCRMEAVQQALEWHLSDPTTHQKDVSLFAEILDLLEHAEFPFRVEQVCP